MCIVLGKVGCATLVLPPLILLSVFGMVLVKAEQAEAVEACLLVLQSE